MVEALAERRLSMTNSTGPSPLPGELLSLGPGDQVEIYRRTTKDRPAWVGPATVKVTDIDHGKLMVQWQGRNLEVPLESVRRALIVPHSTLIPHTTYSQYSNLPLFFLYVTH